MKNTKTINHYNMRVLAFITLFILLTISLQAQTDSTRSINSIKLNFNGLSYGYERALTQRTTLNFELFLASRYYSTRHYSSTPPNKYNWYTTPIIRIEPKFYYNYLKRLENNKNIAHNSANYISLSMDYEVGTSLVRTGLIGNGVQTLRIIPKWGFKRTIYGRFVFEFAAGFGIQFSNVYETGPAAGLDLRIGYHFDNDNKKK